MWGKTLCSGIRVSISSSLDFFPEDFCEEKARTVFRRFTRQLQWLLWILTSDSWLPTPKMFTKKSSGGRSRGPRPGRRRCRGLFRMLSRNIMALPGTGTTSSCPRTKEREDATCCGIHRALELRDGCAQRGPAGEALVVRCDPRGHHRGCVRSRACP